MSQLTDSDFVAQLRGMAAGAPHIGVPGAGSIVAAGRSRVARRRSMLSGAFGVVLLAGAGFATMPQLGLTPDAPVAPVAMVQLDDRVGVDPLEAGLTRGVLPESVESNPAGLIEATAATGSSFDMTPLSIGLSMAAAGSIGAAAGLASKSRQLQPALVKENR